MNRDQQSGGRSTSPSWNVQGKSWAPGSRGFSSTADGTQTVPSRFGDGSDRRGGFGPQRTTEEVDPFSAASSSYRRDVERHPILVPLRSGGYRLPHGFSRLPSETEMPFSQAGSSLQPSWRSRRGGFSPPPAPPVEGAPPTREFQPSERYGFTPSGSSAITPAAGGGFGSGPSGGSEQQQLQSSRHLTSTSFGGTSSDPTSCFAPSTSGTFQRGGFHSARFEPQPVQYSFPFAVTKEQSEKIERRQKTIELIQQEKVKQVLKEEKRRNEREAKAGKRGPNRRREAGFPSEQSEEVEDDHQGPDEYIPVTNADELWAALEADMADFSKREKNVEEALPPAPVKSATTIAKFLREYSDKKLQLNEKDQAVAHTAEELVEQFERSKLSFDKDTLSMLLNDRDFPPVPVLRQRTQMPRPVVLDGCAVARAYAKGNYNPFFEGPTRNAFWTKDRILPMKAMVEAALHFVTHGHRVYIVLPEYYIEPVIGVNKAKTVDDIESYEMLKKHDLLHFVEPDKKSKKFRMFSGKPSNIQVQNPANIGLKNLFEMVQEFSGKIHACFCSNVDIKNAYMRIENGPNCFTGGEEYGQMMEGKLDQQKIMKVKENADERIMNVSFADGRSMHMVRQFSHYAGEKSKIKDKKDFVYVKDETTLFYTESDGDEADYGKRMSQQLTFEQQILQCLDLCQAHELSPINVRAIQMLLIISYRQGILKDEIKAFAKTFCPSKPRRE